MTAISPRDYGAAGHGRWTGGFIGVVRKTFGRWSEDNCMRLAAALACYAVLSLAPLVVLIFKLVTLVLRRAQAQQLIMDQLKNLLGAGASPELLEAILKSSHKGAGIVATGISLGILLLGGSGVFGELQSSMNTIWQVRPKPHQGVWGWLRSRFRSVTMVLGTGFLLLVSLFASTVLSGAARALFGEAKFLGIALDAIFSIAVITLLFAMIFKWLPDVRIAWKTVWLGALVTAVLFTLGKWALTLYFQYAAPTSAYGVFGSLAAVVIWVYYSAQILFFGAEFTRVYARAHGHAIAPAAHAELVQGAER